MKEKINLQLLIENCRGGNRRCQRKLYEYYYGYSLKVVQRYAKNREEAVEILNDAFLKVFLALDKYNSQLPFRPWLHKILVNTAIDYLRSNKGFSTYIELSKIEEPKTIPQDFYPSEQSTDLLLIVQQLPPAYRAVFNLYVMEGYKHKEIAALLGISESTSKSNLTRAKEKLRRLLEKQPGLGTKIR